LQLQAGMKAFLLAMVAVVACGSSTSIEQSWKRPGPHAELHRVVTVMLWRNEGVRRSAEDELAARLKKAGVDAVPGYAVLSAGEVKNPQVARERLLAQGFDGAIVMRFVGRQQEVNYMPPTYAGYWGGAYYPAGGYVTVDTIIRLETAAYSLRDRQLVYSALSRTTDPDSIPSLIDGVTSKVASALEKERVVIAARPAPPQGG
jgi:hypothetical protein